MTKQVAVLSSMSLSAHVVGNLFDVLKNQIKIEGNSLDVAKSDLKDTIAAIAAVKEVRKRISKQIGELKMEAKQLDRLGGGRKSATLNRTLQFFREHYTNLMAEDLSLKYNRVVIINYIKDQSKIVWDLDTHMEIARTADA